MKNNLFVLLICLTGLLLSACSLKEDAAKLYKKETPLEADMEISSPLKADETAIIKVTLTQNGEKVENVDYVHFDIWKQDSSIKISMEEAKNEGNGIYSVSQKIDSEGLYFVKLHASNNNSIIMPQQQFVVGELSESELEYLQRDVKEQEEVHDNHH